MAEFIRGGCGVSIMSKEKLHGSPSTGSEEGHDGAIPDEFDPFMADPEEIVGNETVPNAPPETQLVENKTYSIFGTSCIQITRETS